MATCWKPCRFGRVVKGKPTCTYYGTFNTIEWVTFTKARLTCVRVEAPELDQILGLGW